MTKVAFGAIAGAILGLLLDPLLKLLPLEPVSKGFIDGLGSEVLTLLLVMLGAWLSRRIKRLDRFIGAHLWWIAVVASLLFATSLWLNASRPTGHQALLSVVLAAVTAFLVLTLAGKAFAAAMQAYTPAQLAQATADREKEAQRMALEDPYAAIGAFGLSAAGESGEAFGAGCLMLFLGLFLSALVLAATAHAAHFLYGNTWLGATLTSIIVLVATLGLFKFAYKAGGEHAGRVPLEEKYKPIVPRD
jgi:Na+/H+-dicarboxylate symporter